MNSSVNMKVASSVLVLVMVAITLHPVNGEWAPRGWGFAHATFYGSADGSGTEGGACAYENTFSRGYGAMTAALSTPLFNNGAACGECFLLRCVRIKETATSKNWCWSYSRAITVTATNLCPPGSEGRWCDPPRHHFDLSMPAFSNLARFEGGVVPVFYRRVSCHKPGGIRFTVGGNPWFLMVLIHNVGGAGDLKFVKIHSYSTGWVDMYRNWGALWTVQRKMSGALSFRLTAGNGNVLILRHAVGSGWAFGQTWESHENFHRHKY